MQPGMEAYCGNFTTLQDAYREAASVREPNLAHVAVFQHGSLEIFAWLETIVRNTIPTVQESRWVFEDGSKWFAGPEGFFQLPDYMDFS